MADWMARFPDRFSVQIAALIRDGFAYAEIRQVMPSASPELIAAVARFYGIEITGTKRFREDIRVTARILAVTDNNRTAREIANLVGCTVACVEARATAYGLPLPVRVSKNAA